MRQPVAGVRPEDLTGTLEQLEPEIRQILVRFQIPAQDAEDLLQDVALIFLTKQATITWGSAAPWLLATLRNRCLKYWRQRRRTLIQAIDTGLLEEVAGSSAPEQERGDLLRDLTGAVSHLPGRCRSVLRLRYGLDCEGPEIAQHLGYRQDTVRQVTLRCLSALSRRLLSTGFGHEAYAR